MFTRANSLARKRSSQKNLPFDISASFLKELYKSQEGLCYYSNIPISMVKKDESMLHDPFKMTLDRIEPEKGYVKGNVVWCAYCVNSMKQNMNLEDFFDVCIAVVKKQNKK